MYDAADQPPPAHAPAWAEEDGSFTKPFGQAVAVGDECLVTGGELTGAQCTVVRGLSAGLFSVEMTTNSPDVPAGSLKVLPASTLERLPNRQRKSSVMSVQSLLSERQ
eukprot:5221890-Prymnesium_polylepis.1